MADPTHDVDADDMTPFDPDGDAASSGVGPRGDEIDPLSGTDPIGGETGGLAGTSR